MSTGTAPGRAGTGAFRIGRRLRATPVSAWLCIAWIAVIVVAAVGGSAVAPHDAFTPQIDLRNEPPGWPSTSDFPFVFGTDPLGRDVLSRVIVGARVSLVAGIASVMLSGLIGITLGVIAGYYRGRTESLIMRFVDLQMSLPSLLVAIFVLYVIGPGFVSVVVVLALSRWMIYARVSRAMVLSLREQPFVEAAISLGSGDLRLIAEHILPNIRAPMIVLATLELPAMLLSEAALDFLGLGIQPPDTSWGLMLSDGRQYMSSAPWLVTFPGLVLLVTAASINWLGKYWSLYNLESEAAYAAFSSVNRALAAPADGQTEPAA